MTKHSSLGAAKSVAFDYSKHSPLSKVEVRQTDATEFTVCLTGETHKGALVGIWQGGFAIAA